MIGSVYAAYLHHGGHDVTVLARGRRLADIRDRGILVEPLQSAERIEAKLPTTDRLASDAAYELVLVAMQKGHLEAVLPILATHRGSPSVAFLGNNAAGPGRLVEALGADRVLMGFPDFGGTFEGSCVHFATDRRDARRVGMTLGEVSGITTPRLRNLVRALSASRIDVAVEPRIDAWLKGHAALVVPILFALDRHDLDNRALARDRAGLRLMVAAIRESLFALRDLGYPLTPLKLWSIAWMPPFASTAIFARILESEFARLAFAGHAANAAGEFELLYRELRELIEPSGRRTPALDELCGAGRLRSR